MKFCQLVKLLIFSLFNNDVLAFPLPTCLVSDDFRKLVHPMLSMKVFLLWSLNPHFLALLQLSHHITFRALLLNEAIGILFASYAGSF